MPPPPFVVVVIVFVNTAFSEIQGQRRFECGARGRRDDSISARGDAAACDSSSPKNVPTTVAAGGSDRRFDVEQVRELLDTVARRHRKISDQIVEFGDDPNATQYPVKDARKCDYPLTPVTRPSTAAASLSHAHRGSVSINSGISDVEGDSSISSSSDGAAAPWRDQLQLHVVHLLQKLRGHPDQLRDFLLIQYKDEEEESARRRISVDLGWRDNDEEEDSGEDGSGHIQGDCFAVDENERRARRDRVHKKRVGKNYAKLRLVFRCLHRVAVLMGEQLYHQVHRMLRRSVAHGVLNHQANLVRLDLIYKLELRRQLTTEKLLKVVRLKDAEQKRKRRRQKRDEQHVRKAMVRRKSRMSVAQGGNDGVMETKTPAQNAKDAANTTGCSNLFSLWEQSVEHESITSAHFFKIHALERVLAVERQNRDASFGSSFLLSLDGLHQNSAGELPQRLVSEQSEDLIHEKLTAFLYNKNRDTFPVWKEPPESSFTREETLRHLRRLLPVLMNMPLFHGLSIDQLIEFVRVTQWKSYTHGQKVVQHGASMDELILIMEGSVDVFSSIVHTEFDPDAKVETDATNDDTGEADGEDDANSIVPKAGSRSAVRGIPVYFGELGMLSKTEVWKSTLLVKIPAVKALVISRLAFDLVLQKLFGNSKSRQMLLVAQQRPSSSPTASARTPILVSPTRPSTAAAIQARDKHLAALRQLQETALHQKKLRVEQQCAEVETKTSDEGSDGAVGASHNKLDDSRQGADEGVQVKARQLGRTIQNYPSFESPSRDTTGATGAGHMFRLKWAQPIAFQMESIDDSVYKEWAPSFPDTSAMVDFLSSSSLSSTRLLFEKKNVLLKENLRSVCFQHPFLDGSYATRGHSQAERGGGTPSDDMFTSDHPSPLASTHGTCGSTFGGDISSSTVAAQHDVSGADNMTLAQFSEVRRKTNGRGSSRRHLSSSSSMQHLLSSSTPTSPINSATAMDLGQVAFSRSSFVAESSFLLDRKGNQKQMEILSPNAEEGNEEDSSGDSDFEGAFRSPETQHEHGRNREKSDSAADSHLVKDEGADDPLNPTTKARKMTLDSLMYSMSADSQRKSKLLDQDTAKEIIVKKYLEASSPRASSSSHAKGFQADKKTSQLQGLSGPNGINTGMHNSPFSYQLANKSI